MKGNNTRRTIHTSDPLDTENFLLQLPLEPYQHFATKPHMANRDLVLLAESTFCHEMIAN